VSTPAGSSEAAGPELGFVDAGRLGASLAAALRDAGHAVAAVSRRDAEAADRLASRLGPDVLGTTVRQEVVDAVEVVFVTTVDDRIAEVTSSLRFRPGQTVVHCSGATPVSVLSSAEAAGAATGGLHPLQTFPDEHGAHRFRGVTFGIESASAAVLTWLERLATDLGGRCVTLDEASRPLYHASAVMIGPLTAALAGLACEMWNGLGRDREAGLQALAPLLESTAQHVVRMGLPGAMTGPFVRGDIEPVRAHIDVLRSFRPETLHAYAAVALAQLPLAAERGNIPWDRMQELRALLARAASATPAPPRGEELVSEENHAP
jgi:predicted short-subunit dehydrogenase-like oxidoreductase (DUF2520 family)